MAHLDWTTEPGYLEIPTQIGLGILDRPREVTL
jgi:hypothetical protein